MYKLRNSCVKIHNLSEIKYMITFLFYKIVLVIYYVSTV